MYNLLLKGGRVIDPSQNLDQIMDILINDGHIVALEKRVEESRVNDIVDLNNKLVVPGLIDLHTHVYWKGTSLSVSPDKIFYNSGVTTLVDAGSSGAGNFAGFKEYVINKSKSQITAFLNIAFAGIPYFSEYSKYGESIPLETLIIPAAIDTIEKYPDLIKGIKVRLGLSASGDHGLKPLPIARKVAHITNKPLMVHIGAPPPVYEQIFSHLEAGDILTHAFRAGANKLHNYDLLIEAQKKGIIIDIGHGIGGFSFEVARKFSDKGIFPDTISTDLHILSQKKGTGLPLVMSKMLNLGMPLLEVVSACTCRPAQVLKMEKEKGTLKTGTAADISVLDLQYGDFEFYDCEGERMSGDRRLFPVSVIRKGKIYEINSQ